eukprot:706289_1
MTDNSLQTVPLISEAVECAPEILSSSIKILVKDISANTTMTLEVDSDYTVQKVKHLIKDKKDIPIAQQNIIFKGKLLQNQLDLSYYDIANDTILHLLTTGDPCTIESNPSDDPNTFEEKKRSTTLADALEAHGLYDALYSKLNENQIDLEALQNDLPQNEINSFCDDFHLSSLQKVKFRGLMRTLYKRKNPDSEMTVVLVGESDVGKTCLIRRYAKDIYVDRTVSTIGVDHTIVTETLSDDSSMKITMWDTAGQERFRSVSMRYYRRADCVIICYDSTQKTSLDSCEYWRQQIDTFGKNNVVILLVGCKTDKANKQVHEMNMVKAQSIIEQPQWEKFSAICFECSAKTGYNVNDVFLAAAELVLMNRPTIDENLRHENQLKKEQSKLSNEETNRCC